MRSRRRVVNLGHFEEKTPNTSHCVQCSPSAEPFGVFNIDSWIIRVCPSVTRAFNAVRSDRRTMGPRRCDAWSRRSLEDLPVGLWCWLSGNHQRTLWELSEDSRQCQDNSLRCCQCLCFWSTFLSMLCHVRAHSSSLCLTCSPDGATRSWNTLTYTIFTVWIIDIISRLTSTSLT